MARSLVGIGRAVLSLTAALGLGGCLKAHDDVTVKADGSGTYVETLEVDLMAVPRLRAAARGPATAGRGVPPVDEPGMGEPAMDGPGMEGAATDGTAKPAVPARRASPSYDPTLGLMLSWIGIPGFELIKSTREEQGGKVVLHVEASFATLEAYARASGIEASAELVKNADATYTLTFEGRSPLPVPRPAGGRPAWDGPTGMGADAPPEAAPSGGGGGDAPPVPGNLPGGLLAALPGFKEAFGDLELVRTLKLPGSITATNGTPSDDGRTVTWKVTFDDLKGLSFGSQTVTFKGDGLDLKPFKVERSGRPLGIPRRAPPAEQPK